jgi:glycosyltransferase involved in cell wall biosynthesis
VRFIGSIPHDDLPAYLNAATVYVSTSLSDAGISASTAEAMACELPVVVTNSGENSLWIKDGVDGFLVETRDPATLSQRLIWLLGHPAEAHELGCRARSVIVERNNYEVEMGKIRSLYLDLAKSARN